jgi:hypothetical protein
VARFDLVTGASLATASVPTSPVALTLDARDGSAWAADAGGAVTHLRLDGTPAGAPAQLGAAAMDIGQGEGWLWAATGSSLVRVPLSSGSAARQFTGGPSPVGVGFDAGVWVANANGHLTRFDPRPQRLRVVADVRTGAPGLNAVAAVEGSGAVWALSPQSRAAYRVSPQTERVTGRVSFSARPVALALAGPYVWVATADGLVTQLSASG